jgi:hypothetical protein
MKRAWRLRRNSEEYPDALTRWDRAHQLLLEWSTARVTTDPPASPLTKETCDENCHLRQGLDPDRLAATLH